MRFFRLPLFVLRSTGLPTLNTFLEERGGIGGWGLLLGVVGGGVPHGSPNPDPILNQKMTFSTPVFRPGIRRNFVNIT